MTLLVEFFLSAMALRFIKSSPINNQSVDRRSRFFVQAKSGESNSASRQPWDLGRFAKTVTFFNPPPSLQQVLQNVFIDTPTSILRTLQGSTQKGPAPILPVTLLERETPTGTHAVAATACPDIIVEVPLQGIIMVTGATGGVGRRVVERLLSAGKHVRALVRDVEKARELLSGLKFASGGALELCAADLSQPKTLLPEYFKDVRGLVICSAVKVQPKEGDTPDRAKYMQGIKFYDPEIADNSPQAVELEGMRALLAAAGPHVGYVHGLSILKGDGSGLQQWGALDDVVMGGVSLSSIQSFRGHGESAEEAAMVFRGVVSTSNSGGFASVRSRNFDPALDLGAYHGLELRLKGDGQRYKLILRTDPGWDSIAYCYSFDTQAGSWQTLRIPFSEFFPVFRAKRLKDASGLDPTKLYSVQLMLSKFEYDGELNPNFSAGEFSLPITRIAAYLSQTDAPKVVHVSSAGVTRPNRPGVKLEEEPPAVRMNDMLGGILTFKLAGEDVLRSSGLPYAVVRPCALTEEPAGAPLLLDQGDTIKGKISREDVAELCCVLLSQPAALNCTFEIKSTIPFSQAWDGSLAGAGEPIVGRDWNKLLLGSALEPGVTGKTIDGVYQGKTPDDVENIAPV
ncbi:hypothetical protein CEUSTIGMA_g9885.t1 [Chlamydomonas eustigma]|uniref:NADH:ubiquinone oxidoreductase intermediate-associated protein 30 domain-containing protein n=1 Tax=Chlamydomonas eustigma TaxID=1157962 RepID=A0A250XHA8_9CHLO|nr:hypothetical protein CEUSTIGMA_g9885.t1 [Chlamydomonas eustigma]|eukprot:GAX82458.1 hypothetical protein CEUSTIGMA_g9885.t1 [Chlamydomonas eustigma]